jgi:hypothetical protein
MIVVADVEVLLQAFETAFALETVGLQPHGLHVFFLRLDVLLVCRPLLVCGPPRVCVTLLVLQVFWLPHASLPPVCRSVEDEQLIRFDSFPLANDDMAAKPSMK